MFKVWDKVVCVNAADSGDSLVSGKTYTIGDVQEEYVVLEEDENGYAWMASRFQLALDIDPLVEIHQSEYSALIEEINLLQELLAEANTKLADCLLDKMEDISVRIKTLNESIPEPTVFKPIDEYTMEDWEQAVCNDWMFEQRNGDVVTVIALNDADETTYPVDTDNTWLTLSGREYLNAQSTFDILRRIK